MWILRYRYELEDGHFNSVSFCIDSTGTYTIGRSSKNKLIIKNDKSISREHIRFTWHQDQSLLQFTNQGKLTAANGKYLKPDEAVSFPESLYHSQPIVIELGTKPIRVEVRWQDENWDIPQSLSQFEHLLKTNGINTSSNRKNGYKCNLIVTSEDKKSNWHQRLYGLVNGIRIMKQIFLSDICNMLSEKQDNFDTLWLKTYSETTYLMYPNFPTERRINLFQGFKLFLIGGSEEEVLSTKDLVEKGGGSVTSCDDASVVKSIQVENRESLPIIILLDDSNTRPSNLSGHTIEDLVNAIVKDDLKSLLADIPLLESKTPNPVIGDSPSIRDFPSQSQYRGNQENSISDNTNDLVTPPMKKRRINRERVKPLDSLMFFAGGDKISTQTLPDTQAETSGVHDKVDDKHHADGPNVRKKDTINERQSAELTSIGDEVGGRGNFSKGDVLEETTRLKNEARDANSTKPTEDSLKQPLINEAVESISSSMVTSRAPQFSRRKTLNDYRVDRDKSSESEMSQDPQNFVQIINDAKKHEVKRLSSTLVQVNLDELTEDAINRLGKVTLVQRSDSLIRQASNSNFSSANENNLAEKARKNFKAFKKSLPKYKQRQLGDSTQNTPSSLIRTNAFLIAREYVPLKIYSKDSVAANGPDINEFVESRNITENTLPQTPKVSENDGEKEHSFNFSRSGSAGNALFVVDEDDAPMVSFDEVSNEGTNSRSLDYLRAPTRVKNRISADIEEDDNDDDDDGPKFKFKRQQR